VWGAAVKEMKMSKMAHMALLLALGLSSCNDGLCTDAGCSLNEWISVTDAETASGGLRAGSYTFQISSGELQLEWSCAVAEDAMATPECDETIYSMLDDDGRALYARVRHGADGVHVALSVLFEVNEDGLRIVSGPSSFSLRVHRDDALVGEGLYEPAYSGRWINGEGCSPYCAPPTEGVTLVIP
jgi:hypothetical protein